MRLPVYTVDDVTVTSDASQGGPFLGYCVGVNPDGTINVAVGGSVLQFHHAIAEKTQSEKPTPRAESRECPCGLARVECKYHGGGSR